MKYCLNCQTAFEGAQWICPKCGFQPSIGKDWINFAPSLQDQTVGFEFGFFEHLNRAEVNHFWFDGRNQIIHWALTHFFPKAKSFLEIGCGSGYVLQNLHRKVPQIQFAGSELFNEGLAYAHQRLPDVALYQMDIRAIPFKDEFSVIGVFDVLEHIEADDQALREISRAVVPGGGVIFTIPQHTWLWSAVDDYSHHFRRYSRADFVQKVSAAGFELRYVSSFVSLLLPLMLISRLRQPKSVAEVDPLGEFRIHPLLNRILKTMILTELRLMQTGLSLPMGGSLLVVAQKKKNELM